MQPSMIDFPAIERIVYGRPAAEALKAEAERLGVKRVFLMVSRTMNRETDEVTKVTRTLGDRFAGLRIMPEAGAAGGRAEVAGVNCDDRPEAGIVIGDEMDELMRVEIGIIPKRIHLEYHVLCRREGGAIDGT